MEIVAYSSNSLERDKRNGFNIAGPIYDYDLNDIKTYCAEATKLKMSLVLNMRYIDIMFIKNFIKNKAEYYFYKKIFLKNPNMVLTADETMLVRNANNNYSNNQIFDNNICLLPERFIHFNYYFDLANYELDYVNYKIYYEWLKQKIDLYFDIFKDLKIFGIYLWEEPRPWKQLENNYVLMCIYLIKKYKQKNNLTWKIILFHPQHSIFNDSSLIFEKHNVESLSFNFQRISSYFENVDMITKSIYFDFEDSSRNKLSKEVYYLTKYKLSDVYITFSLYKNHTVDDITLEKMILHDMMICAFNKIKYVFIWSFFEKRKGLEISNFKKQYDAYVKALHYINKKKHVDLQNMTLYEICMNSNFSQVSFDKVEQLNIFKYDHKYFQVMFRLNSENFRNLKFDIEPFGYKYYLIKKNHSIKMFSFGLFFFIFLIIFKSF